MNYVTSITERTIWAVDYFLNRAMVYAWTSVLKRQQPLDEDDYGGGDFCSLHETASADDDQPLD
jgi:hypothetical protein